MGTGQLYIAVSDKLLEWAQDAGQLFIFKIGIASDPPLRLRSLNRGFNDGRTSKPCLGFTDWRWAELWPYDRRAAAGRDEADLKKFLKRRWRVFDRTASPHDDPRSRNGESEVFLITPEQLPELDAAIAGLKGGRPNFLIGAAVLTVVAGLIRREVETLFPTAEPEDEMSEDQPFDDEPIDEDEGATEHDDELNLLRRDLADDADEFAASREDGWPYGDAD